MVATADSTNTVWNAFLAELKARVPHEATAEKWKRDRSPAIFMVGGDLQTIFIVGEASGSGLLPMTHEEALNLYARILRAIETMFHRGHKSDYVFEQVQALLKCMNVVEANSPVSQIAGANIDNKDMSIPRLMGQAILTRNIPVIDIDVGTVLRGKADVLQRCKESVMRAVDSLMEAALK